MRSPDKETETMNLRDQLQEYSKPRDTSIARESVFRTEPILKSQESHHELLHIKEFKASLESHR